MEDEFTMNGPPLEMSVRVSRGHKLLFDALILPIKEPFSQPTSNPYLDELLQPVNSSQQILKMTMKTGLL